MQTGSETAGNWQGWVSEGTRQGQYRAVPCLQISNRGRSIRVVTVLAPHPCGHRRLEGVSAAPEPDSTVLTIRWHDGSALTLDETDPDKLFPLF